MNWAKEIKKHGPIRVEQTADFAIGEAKSAAVLRYNRAVRQIRRGNTDVAAISLKALCKAHPHFREAVELSACCQMLWRDADAAADCLKPLLHSTLLTDEEQGRVKAYLNAIKPFQSTDADQVEERLRFKEPKDGIYILEEPKSNRPMELAARQEVEVLKRGKPYRDEQGDGENRPRRKTTYGSSLRHSESLMSDRLHEARFEAEQKRRQSAEKKRIERARRELAAQQKRRAEEEAKRKAEEEAKRKAEEEAKRKAEEEAKRKAEEEAKRKAEEEAKRKAEEEAKRKAEEEAKRKAEEKTRRKAEEKTRRKTGEETGKGRLDLAKSGAAPRTGIRPVDLSGLAEQPGLKTKTELIKLQKSEQAFTGNGTRAGNRVHKTVKVAAGVRPLQFLPEQKSVTLPNKQVKTGGTSAARPVTEDLSPARSQSVKLQPGAGVSGAVPSAGTRGPSPWPRQEDKEVKASRKTSKEKRKKAAQKSVRFVFARWGQTFRQMNKVQRLLIQIILSLLLLLIIVTLVFTLGPKHTDETALPENSKLGTVVQPQSSGTEDLLSPGYPQVEGIRTEPSGSVNQ